MDFQEVCDVADDLTGQSHDLRSWFFVALMSPSVRASLFDETVPDDASLARVSRKSAVAKRVVAEWSGRMGGVETLDPVNTVVDLLVSLSDLTYRMGLEGEVEAAAEPLIRKCYQALCELYGVLVGLPRQSIGERIEWLESQHPEISRELRASHEALLRLREAMEAHGIDTDKVMPDMKVILGIEGDEQE